MDSDPALDRLWDVIAARLQRNGLQPVGVVRLDGIAYEERRAITGLLGRQLDPAAGVVSIDLRRLDERLRHGGRGGLVAEAERRRGPLVDRAAARSARAAAEQALWSFVRDELRTSTIGDRAWIEDWLHAIRPVLARAPAAAQRQLAANAIRCTSILSEVDRASLARTELASIVAGDAHALDDGRRLTALVLRAVALALGVPYGETPAQRRELWRVANVLCDEVSTTALCAGLTPVDDGTAASLLRARSAERWATHLTMRDLDQLRWAQPPMVVSVCENPRVLERAIDTGSNAPIVCTQGNPTFVTRRLLHELAATGARLRYHGDFDWPGIVIANRVIGELKATPWRFGADDYRDALELARTLTVELPELGDGTAFACWDNELGATMTRAGRAVHEELVVDLLVADLA